MVLLDLAAGRCHGEHHEDGRQRLVTTVNIPIAECRLKALSA